MNKIFLLLIAFILISGVGYSFFKLSTKSDVTKTINNDATQAQPININDELNNSTNTFELQDQMVIDNQVMDKSYTLEEVATHDNKSDCWLVIENKVYDVTDAIDTHPGGDTILEGCGLDATTLFKTRPMGDGTDHPAKAYQFLENLYLGELAN